MKVFLHYSWDSEAHKEWVLELANRLTVDGVDLVFDRYDLHVGSNNLHFMEKIEACQKVVLVMSKGYKPKVDSRTGGAGYEYQIITSEIAVKMASNSKCIPVLRDGDAHCSIPVLLQHFQYIDMRDDKKFEQLYLELLRAIYDKPLVTRPEVGKKPSWENNFMTDDKDIDAVKPKHAHDIIANSLYRVLAEIENDAEIDREKLMQSLETVYKQSKEMSRDSAVLTAPEFPETIDMLLLSFQNDKLLITISGNDASLWGTVAKQFEYNVKAILNDVMVIMNEHGISSHIHWRFERIGDIILISYGNNSEGKTTDLSVVNSLESTKRTVKSIGGKMDFSPVFNEIRIQLPLNKNNQNVNLSKINDDDFEFSVFDITIIELLSKGVLQKDIPQILHSRNLKPSTLSSVEKRLNSIKEEYSLKSNAELVAFFKDIGII
ncbi:toll/interleukin-1 receptor domain-containing protein [Chryseobacterium sp. MMS23-Vi53]|uniref:toll/interleukin-1 receptor domain-containing protein n=1 Tax=Chryseobacterium sp. MMS23-Vi53 TaxID=3386644 RepID=UPI0039EB1F56